MASIVNIAGTNYSVPATGDSNWSDDLTNFFIALATSTKVLQVTSNSFPITQDLSFGTTYGLKLQYIKSQATNPSSTGILRLGNTEAVSWRNAGNTADLSLSVNASNVLQYNGNTLLDTSMSAMTGLITNTQISPSAAIAYSKLALSNSITNTDVSSAAAISYSKLNLSSSIVNSDVSASAAIAYSKLNLAGSITNSDVSNTAGIVYSKLSLSNSIVNADINSAAAIAYSKLNLTGNILNADISAGAAIALSKLAVVTAGRALISDASGYINVSTTTANELAYLSGVTSAIQTQFSGKENSITTLSIAKGGTNNSSLAVTSGGVLYTDGTKLVNTGAGTSGQVLTSQGPSAPIWTSPLTNPMTSVGDIIIGGTSGAATRLAIGLSGQYLTVSSGTPAWTTPNLPTVQKFTSGSGTYTTPVGVKYIRVKAIGAGGGGSGSGTASAGNGGNGGDTTFGGVIAAGGGLGGAFGVAYGGSGGVASVGTGPIGTILSGGRGGGVTYTGTSPVQVPGGSGGNGFFGGAATSTYAAAAGFSATTNTGAGGAGGGTNGTSGSFCGSGGGSGGFVDVIIPSPAATYAYAIGSGGSAGTAGTNGYAGGTGASGIIIVEEHY